MIGGALHPGMVMMIGGDRLGMGMIGRGGGVVVLIGIGGEGGIEGGEQLLLIKYNE
jgi:hypothetical protein